MPSKFSNSHFRKAYLDFSINLNEEDLSVFPVASFFTLSLCIKQNTIVAKPKPNK